MGLPELFPGLATSGFRLTSERAVGYNCLAWAAGVDDAWWDPAAGYFWPEGIPRNGSVETLIMVYEALGFMKCEREKLEPGFEKVAIYGLAERYTHVARQLTNGHWTSKLGTLEDIEHATLAGLTGKEYGRVAQIMRRKLTPSRRG